MVTEVLAGSLLLERLAAVGLVDSFIAAVDEDDFAQARTLMRRVDIDADTIDSVLSEMADGEDIAA